MNIISVGHNYFPVMTFNVEFYPSTRRNRNVAHAIQYRPGLGLLVGVGVFFGYLGFLILCFPVMVCLLQLRMDSTGDVCSQRQISRRWFAQAQDYSVGLAYVLSTSSHHGTGFLPVPLQLMTATYRGHIAINSVHSKLCFGMF